ncbi:Protein DETOXIFICATION [Heracleum sosnowskyi]|uniref:Protein DETOXIFICATION n=1 Tax=Heracleum sosnowskyi TaxID=360622 RepID=A0AAD8M8I9_9APIA|nr:Protein DETOXIFICATION [Heracleum sosnowskyi]
MEEPLLEATDNRQENKGVVAVETSSSRWEVVLGEIKKVSYIAMPMVVTTVSQNLIRVISMMMIGHLGELSLSGAAIATSLTNVTGFSLLLGMASALETLCGQAYGAEQYQMIGTYTCGAIISLLLVCIPVSILWIYTEELLIMIGQDPLISHEAGTYSIWLIPALFPYAILQLFIRFLLTQSLIYPMLLSSVAALVFHIPLSWLLIFKFKFGSAGGALGISLSYLLNVILLGIYVKYASSCEKTRISFSKDVFPSIREFFRFGIPSAVMICLDWWSYELVILLSGLLANPQLETSVLSICLVVTSLHYFIPYSFGAGASTRVSNELGAGNPEAARLAAWVATFLAVIEVVIASTILFSCKSILGYAFGEEKEVVDYVKEMTPLLSVSIMVECLAALFCGVARGVGWQHIGAYVNLGAYYLCGIPMACVLAFVLNWRGKGLWIGLTTGSLLQSCMLMMITFFTDWKKQAREARQRIFEGRSQMSKGFIIS